MQQKEMTSNVVRRNLHANLLIPRLCKAQSRGEFEYLRDLEHNTGHVQHHPVNTIIGRAPLTRTDAPIFRHTEIVNELAALVEPPQFND